MWVGVGTRIEIKLGRISIEIKDVEIQEKDRMIVWTIFQ